MAKEESREKDDLVDLEDFELKTEQDLFMIPKNAWNFLHLPASFPSSFLGDRGEDDVLVAEQLLARMAIISIRRDTV